MGSYFASLYLSRIIIDGKETLEKTRQVFAEQITWYSDAIFESVQNVYNGSYTRGLISFSSILSSHLAKKVLEKDSEMKSMMSKGVVYIDLSDKHASILKLFDSYSYPILNLSSLCDSMLSAKNEDFVNSSTY